MSRPTSLMDAPFLLGFDQTRALIDRAQRAAADSYPPYNVERIGDEVRITLAVAGFTPEELNVTVEGRQLTLTGKRDESPRPEAQYLHRGIASRGFVRTFVLADGPRGEGIAPATRPAARGSFPARSTESHTQDPDFHGVIGFLPQGRHTRAARSRKPSALALRRRSV